MENKTTQDEGNNRPHEPSFQQRFDIETNLEEAKLRFVNRVLNAIDLKMNGLATKHDYPYRYDKEMIYVANVLGEEASGASPLKYYTGTDFNKLPLMPVHKPLHSGQGFLNLSQRGGITTADISLPALSKGSAWDYSYLFLHQEFFAKFL